MRVIEAYGIEAAETARGHVVVIDVLRAFTCAAYAFGAGAEAIALVASVEDAFAVKRARPDVLLMGHGTKTHRVDGFDFGNSPAEIARADLRGRTLVQRTGNGTNGVARCAAADAICIASFVNASATARHVRDADVVTLLALGGGRDGPEDIACRDVIAALLRGETPDWAAAERTVRACPAAAELMDPSRGIGCPEDVDLALAFDRFDFAIPVESGTGLRTQESAPPSLLTAHRRLS